MKRLFKKIRKQLLLLLLLLVLLPSVFALFHQGFYGASDDMHVAWLYEMDRTISMGQIPPRFVPDLSYRFGYPLFSFVFPLPFYLGEVFYGLRFSYVDSLKIVFGISLVASGLGMYLLLKQMLPSILSFAGAVLYVFTPYRSTDVYDRGAVGESLAFVFLPLLVYSAIKIFKKKSWKNISVYALSLAGLILSHNIISYMFFPFFLLFSVILYLISKNKKEFILSNIFGIVSGLLVSLYFWLPAILESRLMKYDTVFNFKDHFPTIRQLITPYFGYGASVPGPGDGISFFIGLMNLFLIVLGVILMILYWKKIKPLEKAVLTWLVAVFSVSIFMMNHRSSFVWDNLPLLPYFQFPWRFLTLVTFISPLFVISLKYLPKIGKYLAILIAVVAIIINCKYFRPHDFLERKDQYYLDRYIPKQETLDKYREIQEEYLRLPLGTKIRPSRLYPEIYSAVDFSFEKVKEKGMYVNYQVFMPKDGEINFSKYYYPGWYVKVDGKKAEIIKGDPFSQIAIALGKGIHTIEIGFKETNFRLFLDIISLLTLVGCLSFVIEKKRKNR